MDTNTLPGSDNNLVLEFLKFFSNSVLITLKYLVKGCSFKPEYSAGKPPPTLKKSTSKLDALIKEDVLFIASL